MEFELDSASGEPKGSELQPFSDRRHTRSGNDGADDDKDAHDSDKHIACTRLPMQDHDARTMANNEPVDVHPPGEQATQHYGSACHMRVCARVTQSDAQDVHMALLRTNGEPGAAEQTSDIAAESTE